MSNPKTFILYDGRASAGDPDAAAVLDTAETEQQAGEAGHNTWAGYDAIWYEYQQRGDKLVNGTPRYDLLPRSQDA